MLSTLVITFREGVEALLIVGIAAAYLRRSGQAALMLWLGLGALAGIAGSALLGTALVELGGLGSLWEGVLALVAMVLVLTCTVHPLRHGRAMKGRIVEGLERANSKAYTNIAVFLFALLMVGREGVEAAAMIAAIVAGGAGTSALTGGVLGLVLAAGLASAWLIYGRAVNLTLFFNATATFMVLFSIQLVIYAVHEFSEAGVLPLVDNGLWHFRTEPFGPEGQWGILLSYMLVLAPVALIVWTHAARLLNRSFRPTHRISPPRSINE